jgi:hypothetical protein
MKSSMCVRALSCLGLLSVAGVALAQVSPCTPDDLSGIPVRTNIDFPTDVQAIFSVACDGCHIGGASGGLSLAPGSAYTNIVNVSANNANANMPRITPGNPTASFLFQKINCTNLNSIAGTPYGFRMPRSGPPYLSAADQAMIVDWIREGAPAMRNPERIFTSAFDGRN